MEIKGQQVVKVKMANLETISQCHKIWRRSASFAPVDHPVLQVLQDHLDLQARKEVMAHQEAQANKVVLDRKDLQVLQDLQEAMENQVQKVHLAKMAQREERDRTVMLDPPDHLARQAAKATMVNLVKVEVLDHLAHQDHPVKRPMIQRPVNQDHLAHQVHLAKMLNIAHAHHEPGDSKPLVVESLNRLALLTLLILTGCQN